MKKLLFLLMVPCALWAADTEVVGYTSHPTTNSFASMDGQIVDVDSGSLPSGRTDYSYFNLVNDGFNAFAVQYDITATTLTFEGTLDEVASGTGGNYVDITLMLTDDAYSSITSSGSLTVSKTLPWNRIRIRRLTTNATNSLDIWLTRVKY